MPVNLLAEAALLRKYGRSAPSYACYPTADQFLTSFTAQSYRGWLESRQSVGLARPLALYVHLPSDNTPAVERNSRARTVEQAAQAARYLGKEIDLLASAVNDHRAVSETHWAGAWSALLNRPELAELLRRIESRFDLHACSFNTIELDAAHTDSDSLGTLFRLGFNRITLDTGALGNNGQSSAALLKRVVSLARGARHGGFKAVTVRLVFAFPWRDPTDVGDAIEAVAEAGPARIVLIARRATLWAGLGVAPSDSASELEPAIQLLVHGITRLQEVGYIHVGLNHFAQPVDELAIAQRRGRLCHDLRGFTAGSDGDLLSLGAGAISQIGRCYSQNAIDTEQYRRALDSDHLPVLRGRNLNADDLVRRGVIRALICHCEVSLESIAIAYLIDFEKYFRAEMTRLEPLADDGLIELDDGWITLTPVGRLLVRTICAVFDRYRTSA